MIARARELDDSDQAVIATDAAGVVVYWGAGAESLYGWTEAEALGHNVLDLTPSELSRAEAEDIMRLLRRGEPWFGEFVVNAKEGVRFTVEVTDLPVRDAAGELVGIVGTSRRTSYMGRA